MTRLYRDSEEIDDVLLPNLGTCPLSKREMAIRDVLCRIPELDYCRLLEAFQDFSWFVPDAEVATGFVCFNANADITMKSASGSSSGKLAMVIYLSPILENSPNESLLSVIADMLAHVIMGHDVVGLSGGEIEETERSERSRKLAEWGFA